MVLIVAPQSFSDSTDFKITDYIPQKFEDFQLFVDGGGGFRNSKKYYDIITRTFPDEDDDSKLRFSISSFYVNETIQRKTNFRFEIKIENETSLQKLSTLTGIQTSYEKSNSDLELDSKKLQLNLELEREEYIHKDLFVGSSFAFDYNYGSSEYNSYNLSNIESRFTGTSITRVRIDTSLTYREGESSNNGYSYDFEIKIGFGRVYIGQFAATANYFIRKLKSKQLLNKSLSKNEMIALTDLFQYYKNKQAIDSRLLRIEAFETIANYLIENKLISGDGLSPAFVLQDIWDYFPKGKREFGFQVTFGVLYEQHTTNVKDTYSSEGHEYSIQYNFPTSDQSVIDTTVFFDSYSEVERWSDQSENGQLASLITNVSYLKPIGFDWQLSINMWSFYRLHSEYNSGPNFSDDYNYVSKENIDFDNEFEVYYDFMLTYTPTTRTRLNVSSFGRFRRIDHTSNVVSETTFNGNTHVNKHQSNTRVNYGSYSTMLDIEYRISIPTTLKIETMYSTLGKDSYSFTFATSIRHYLF